MVGLAENKANSALLELELRLGMSLAIIKRSVEINFVILIGFLNVD